MYKPNCIFPIILLMFLAIGSKAQDSFVVVAVKGNVLYNLPDTNLKEKLSFGAVLPSNITLQANSFPYILVISDSSMVPLEYRSEGKIPINTHLNERKKKSNPSLQANIRQAFDTLAAATKLSGVRYKKPENEWMQLENDNLALSPSHTKTANKEITLKWKKYYDNSYWVEIFNPSTEQSYFLQKTNETEITIAISEVRFPSDRCLYWRVKVANSEFASQPKCIFKYNIDEASYVDVPIYNLLKAFPIENSAFNNLMLAQFYEKMQILHKAEEHYRQAWLFSGLYEPYKRIYYHFLSRRNSFEVVR